MHAFFTKLYTRKTVNFLCCLAFLLSHTLLTIASAAELQSRHLSQLTTGIYAAYNVAPATNNRASHDQRFSICEVVMAFTAVTICSAAGLIGFHELFQESREELLELAGVKQQKVIEEFGKAISYQE